MKPAERAASFELPAILALILRSARHLAIVHRNVKAIIPAITHHAKIDAN
jgi:hypothetical protein